MSKYRSNEEREYAAELNGVLEYGDFDMLFEHVWSDRIDCYKRGFDAGRMMAFVPDEVEDED